MALYFRIDQWNGGTSATTTLKGGSMDLRQFDIGGAGGGKAGPLKHQFGSSAVDG